ncbi:MAG: hypothetical protein JWM92_439 [Candidatus Nomurabacteria bacterium]|jgi:tRNA threonylcarbamoyladenosine biosynthesis protein TsaE|nr:hypothetical protein [Candidatus Nomurabacteria bacterium]
MDRLYTESDTADIAREILGLLKNGDRATVLALQGDLGAGKTTLTKVLAEQLGVQETVVSPTFVIAKFYDTPIGAFERMAHIDAYRIESLDELGPLGWETLLQQPDTLVIVEWPEKITDALPQEKIHFAITHEGEQRRIKQII